MSSVAQDLLAVKEAQRELHGLLKEAKEVRREMDQVIKKNAEEIESFIVHTVAQQLSLMGSSVEETIVAAQDAVYKRFDTVVDILLGEDKKSRKDGKVSLLDLAVQLRDLKLHSIELFESEEDSE